MISVCMYGYVCTHGFICMAMYVVCMAMFAWLSMYGYNTHGYLCGVAEWLRRSVSEDESE